MKENNLGWHFTRGNNLRDGRPIPPVGEALVYNGKLELCLRGLHCSVRLVDALMYAPGVTLHQVRFGGNIFWGVDKLVSSERTILRTLPQTETMLVLVKFAQWCAQRVAKETGVAARAEVMAEAVERAEAVVGEDMVWVVREVAARATAWAANRAEEEELQNAKLLALVEEAFLDLGGGL